MTYLAENFQQDLLHLLGLEVTFHLLSLSLYLSLSLFGLLKINFVSETNKFHYFDEYFNLLLRDADSGGEELLVNNITLVSISSFLLNKHALLKNILFTWYVFFL